MVSVILSYYILSESFGSPFFFVLRGFFGETQGGSRFLMCGGAEWSGNGALLGLLCNTLISRKEQYVNKII